jgi:hypothetical protein
MKTEQQRITEYQAGWNDGQADRGIKFAASLTYMAGYLDATRGK